MRFAPAAALLLSSSFVTAQERLPELERCLTPEQDFLVAQLAIPGDCSINQTVPDARYAPVTVYDIPVVVHVIQSASGGGALSDAAIQSQIDVLNEDFRALAGSNGQSGVDTRIQFHLATTDPGGQPTTGITRSTNNSWYFDIGSYWTSLAWDPSRYLNVYTNTASGALGYVPYLPQEGPAGSSSDRVVVLWEAFGRGGAIGAPYDQGRTLTHEVGHYLGLLHTFDGGCGQASAPGCYATGDLVCDTSNQAEPTSGCSDAASCGTPDPIRNYMDYSTDLCMQGFTHEQALRMRCTLESYRPNLFTPLGPERYCTATANTTGLGAAIDHAGSVSVSANDLELLVSNVPPGNNGIFITSPDAAQVPLGDGNLCVGTQTLGFVVRIFPAYVADAGGRADLVLDHTSPQTPSAQVLAGSTWYYQAWFRDFAQGGAGFNFSDGLRVTYAP